jgi:hypothetical protein
VAAEVERRGSWRESARDPALTALLAVQCFILLVAGPTAATGHWAGTIALQLAVFGVAILVFVIRPLSERQTRNRDFSARWFAYLETEDVDALRAEFVGRGARCSEPKDQPCGMREMIVTTIYGHRIVVGQEKAA